MSAVRELVAALSSCGIAAGARQVREAQGRSLLLYQGLRVRGAWWRDRSWKDLSGLIPQWLKDILEYLRTLILKANELLEKVSREIESQAPQPPKGFGLLTREAPARR